MKYYSINKYIYFIEVCFLSGCSFQNQEIRNQALRDRVIACGAGFSDSALGSLGASYAAYPFEAQASTGFRTSAREIIFSELPPQDRLKAYQNYITCIESNTFPTNKDYKK
ncbi:MAG: hypothetical protein BGO77_02985 [Caedibacter sp. 37-49]|nr:MAG: hypothetical protein BGO77_02985 [Caedibacter sp. 37-49]